MSTFQAKLNMWEVFNIPPVQPVIYNSILRTRREFSDLVHGYMSHHFEHDKIHCCKIVPDLSSFSEKQKIFIIILADFPSKSNMCFRIKISNRDILDEVNKYLVFMKRIKYEAYYLLSDESFYVTCQHFENWNLFYDIYKLLLSKPITTILGTQFYHSFVCKNLMYNELKFLKTCSVMKNFEALFVSTKPPMRNLCEILADNVYAYHFPGFCSPSKKEKDVHEVETDTRTFGFKTVASNSTKRKLINSLNNTAKHEPQIKRKKMFEDCPTSCYSHQREKIQTSPQIFRETNYVHSCDKLLKRKLVDIQSCVNEIPLKQPKIKSSSNCEHSHESSAFHKLSNSPKQSLCRYSKWKMFSNIEHFGPINYVDLLSSKCDLDKSSNILRKNQTQFYTLLPHPQQERTSFKSPQSTKLKVISTYALSEPNECKYFKIEPAMLHKDVKRPNDSCSSSTQILSKEPSSKLNPVCASVSRLKEYTQFQPRCSNEHGLKLNKNSVKSVSGFKTAGGNAILCSQTALLTAQNVLQDVFDENMVEKNDSFSSTTLKKNYSKLVKSGNGLNRNSIADSETKDVDETKMDSVLAKHFFDEECFDEKTTDLPLKVNENDIESFRGFTSAGGNAIKCSQSALLAAQKILQSISEETTEEKKESLNSGKKSNHLSQGGGNFNPNSVAFCETEEVDDTQIDIILSENIFAKQCLDKEGTNLPSMVSESKAKSLSGFKSAGGNAIKCSQSALMAAQKMLLDVSNEKDEDQNECVNLVVPKKGKSTVRSKDNLDRNLYDLQYNENLEEPQIDIALPENFFTERCFDESESPHVFPNNQKVEAPSASILSEDVSNTSSNKRKKTLGTRRSLPMLPKKDMLIK